jgi:precorrin-6y C5,15-methyltransferase (decarboxylating) CbiE subunit
MELPAAAKRVELPASGMVDAVVNVLEVELKNSHSGNVSLLVSGDPGFYSLAKRVVSHFGREQVRVIPGISSLQIMAAKIGRSWVNARTATVHGRDFPDVSGLVSRLRGSAALVVLLGGADDAAEHMRRLADDDALGRAWAAVGWDLGLPEETVLEAPTLRDLLREPHVGRLALLWLEEA